MVTVAPYGSWPSAVTPELLVEKAVGLSATGHIGGRPAWVESRPSEAGRAVLVVAGPRGEPVDVIPPGFSVRSAVHEYGGRCWASWGDGAVFTNWEDQRIYTVTPAADGTWGPPVPVTPEPPAPRATRYADIEVSPDGRWLVAVRERHLAAGGESGGVDNDLVSIRLDGPLPATPEVLAAGHDFVAAGRISPDGRRLAWLTWDHPDMPWDHTELWVSQVEDGRLRGDPARVAGADGESVSQPRWSPSGVLHFVSDRTGWWNLYDETGRALAPLAAEFSRPDWVVGQASYAFLPGGDIVAAWSSPAGDRLGLVRAGEARDWGLEISYVDSVVAAGATVLTIVGSGTEAPAVVEIAVDPEGTARMGPVLRRSREARLPAGAVAVPEAVEFPTTGGRRAHAYWYPPTNPGMAGPDGERPPLVVMSHGGPTSAALPVLNYGVQFWTSRGFGVVDVDYGGSTGYGRAYRNQLRDNWGVVDVDDCVAAARWLADDGRVDPDRMVIRGGSAGGYTTLAALAFRDVFAGGASLYGVADLELLATDTHKFESRYLDGLVGPYPEAQDRYRARSPIHHLDGLDRPIILFQGLEDAVVPPAQSQLMADALAARGVPVAHLTFTGEQHGFRQATTIVTVALAELAFYGRVLGFAPADDAPAFPIVNESALRPAGR